MSYSLSINAHGPGYRAGKDFIMITRLRKRWDNKKWGLSQIGIYMSDADKTTAFDREAEIYCSQNNQDCDTCSLVNYNLDCHNNRLN